MLTTSSIHKWRRGNVELKSQVELQVSHYLTWSISSTAVAKKAVWPRLKTAHLSSVSTETYVGVPLKAF